MSTIFAALATLYTSAAQCAAALGISRQAYSQAAKRRRLSEPAAIKAAALIGIKPAAALLCNATGKDIPAPKRHPTPDTTPQIQDAKKPLKTQAESDPPNNEPTTNYARLDILKESSPSITTKKIVHVIAQSEKRLFEIDCVKWMLCVPRISPDSPRFANYFSRWVVPEKIARAKADGTFEETVKNCPLFSPELMNFIQHGIDEYHAFKALYAKARPLEQPPALKVKPPHATTKKASLSSHKRYLSSAAA